MYQAVYALETIGEFNTFEEAFSSIYHKLNADMKDSGMSWQLLETAIWVERTDQPPAPPLNPLLFYDARDKAVLCGLLKDGVLQEDVLERAKENASS